MNQATSCGSHENSKMSRHPDLNLYPDSAEVDAQIIAGLRAEIERLKDENQRLRSEVSRSSYHCD